MPKLQRGVQPRFHPIRRQTGALTAPAARLAAPQRFVGDSPCKSVASSKPHAEQAADTNEEGAGEAIKAPDREQLVALLRAMRDEWIFPVACVAAATGARRGEILALRWQDVDLVAGSIRIERSVEETNTKGVRFKLPKNKASRRPIGIDGGLVALLRGHKARQAETG